MADRRASREVYSQQDNPAFETLMATRTAAREAAFFLPHLRSGMQVLDVGCGPGSITLGLAEVVVLGEVVGIDVQPSQVQRARDQAVQRGVANVRFDVGDAYRLPFPTRSFDAVFAHTVLMHLREPVRALSEMRRVLRPGGIVGVRDPDYGTMVFAPATPLLEQWLALMIRLRQHSGGDPFVGRHLRRLLLEGGFVRADASASVWNAGSLEETRRYAAFYKTWSVHALLTEGVITQGAVNAMRAEFDAWAERPHAFHALTFGEAVGWMAD
jgi:ubiquinone/menaquinone biosynthesis C-methylase UbiE